MSLLGFPIMPFIDIDDAEGVLQAIRDTSEDEPIEIILHTPDRASGLPTRRVRPEPARRDEPD